jgi:hypothetical protein
MSRVTSVTTVSTTTAARQASHPELGTAQANGAVQMLTDNGIPDRATLNGSESVDLIENSRFLICITKLGAGWAVYARVALPVTHRMCTRRVTT